MTVMFRSNRDSALNVVHKAPTSMIAEKCPPEANKISVGVGRVIFKRTSIQPDVVGAFFLFYASSVSGVNTAFTLSFQTLA